MNQSIQDSQHHPLKEQEYPIGSFTSSQRWLAVSVLLSGTFMAILDVFIVLVAVPSIQQAFHANDADIQLVLAGYQLTYAMTLITAGRLGDFYGRRRLFLIGLLVFTLASVLCGLSPTVVILIIARLIQGIGAALLFPQVFAMIQILLPQEKERARAFGVMGAVIGLATIVGQLAGGWLIQANLFGYGWQLVFLVNVPIGIIALIATSFLVPEVHSYTTSSVTRRLDGGGVLLLSTALFLLTVPLVEGRELGWPLWTEICLILTIPAFVAFVLFEKRASAQGLLPLVELSLFKERLFVIGTIMIFIYYSALNSFFLILSLMLQYGIGLSAFDAGLTYAPLAIMFFLSSLIASRFHSFARYLLSIGSLIMAIGFGLAIAAALQAGGHLTTVVLIPTLVVQGIGMGLFQTPLLNAVLRRVRPHEVGTASGILSTSQQVGGAIGVAIVGVIFFSLLGNATSGTAVFVHAFGLAVIYQLLVAFCVFALALALLSRSSVR